MRLLFDTHAWLWALTLPQRLRPAVLAVVNAPEHERYLSAVSSWEIAIKYAVGKLPLPEPPESYMPDRIRTSRVMPLAIDHSHALRAGSLPLHHRDPFDRLLIAQALLEGLTILTADPVFDRYEVGVLRAG